jgi:hypothetical protein
MEASLLCDFARSITLIAFVVAIKSASDVS